MPLRSFDAQRNPDSLGTPDVMVGMPQTIYRALRAWSDHTGFWHMIAASTADADHDRTPFARWHDAFASAGNRSLPMQAGAEPHISNDRFDDAIVAFVRGNRRVRQRIEALIADGDVTDAN